MIDHPAYYKGGSVQLTTAHIHVSQASRINIQNGFLKNAYISTDNSHTGALMSGGSGTHHQWAPRNMNTNKKDTICAKELPGPAPITFQHLLLTRVRVKGPVNSKSIRSACKSRQLVPLCDHAGVSACLLLPAALFCERMSE